MPLADGYPYLNKIFGDAAYEIKLVSLNAGIPIGDDAELYATATWGEKHAASFENYRVPTRVTYTDPDTDEVTYFAPFGFNPREETEETDYQATIGIKGSAGTWDWDISSDLRQGRYRHLHARLGQRVVVRGNRRRRRRTSTTATTPRRSGPRISM